MQSYPFHSVLTLEPLANGHGRAAIFQSCPQSGNEWTNEFINKSQSYPPYNDRVGAWSAVRVINTSKQQ